MLAKRIIPCLDVHAGRVVKGVNFLNLQDAGDPVQIARRYEQQGPMNWYFSTSQPATNNVISSSTWSLALQKWS